MSSLAKRNNRSPALPSPRRPHNPLTIGFVFDDTLDNPDGVQQYITTLGQWLAGQGHAVRYLVGQTAQSTEREDVYPLTRNVSVRFNKNRLSIPLPANRQAIGRVLEHEKFDVLHVQLPCSPLMGGRVIQAASPDTVVVGTFHIVGHHWLAAHGTKLLGLWQRATLARFDHIVSVSAAAQAFAKRHFNGTDTVVLPNVVDLASFEYITPLETLQQQKTTIVFLGRLVERKGCRYLIEAIRRLNDRGAANDLQVFICGKGPLESTLKQLVRQHGLGNIITFAGFVSEEDKRSYLAAADLAVFPSTGGESFGIVLVEAMAAGAGVVMGGDNEGYRTVLGRQANHLLFNPRHTREFADKIQLLLTNPVLRKQLHRWQQQEVKQYDVTIVGPKLVQLYQQPNHKRSLLKTQE